MNRTGNYLPFLGDLCLSSVSESVLILFLGLTSHPGCDKLSY
jgi:hypothetical protein